jgi:hypothetical protein
MASHSNRVATVGRCMHRKTDYILLATRLGQREIVRDETCIPFSHHTITLILFSETFSCAIRVECRSQRIILNLIMLIIFGEAPHIIMLSVLMYFLSLASKYLFSQ